MEKWLIEGLREGMYKINLEHLVRPERKKMIKKILETFKETQEPG